ncbi:MAG: hypothetical protein NWQ24_12100, partial [Haliea sp.]|nr:hypothetical protein [Haliea sp.]
AHCYAWMAGTPLAPTHPASTKGGSGGTAVKPQILHIYQPKRLCAPSFLRAAWLAKKPSLSQAHENIQ